MGSALVVIIGEHGSYNLNVVNTEVYCYPIHIYVYIMSLFLAISVAATLHLMICMRLAIATHIVLMN